MAETEVHVWAIILLLEALKSFLHGRTDWYTVAGILWYWQEGNLAARCSPDVMAIRGVENRLRISFRSWEENNVVPRVIFEISSEETWRNDLRGKRELYARLGVSEYFLFDPEAAFLDPPLRGFHLENGVLEELQPAADGSLICRELGLRLIREGRMLRLMDLETGEKVLTQLEQAEHQRQRAELSEAENERLKQLLATLTQQKNGGATPS